MEATAEVVSEAVAAAAKEEREGVVALQVAMAMAVGALMAGVWAWVGSVARLAVLVVEWE